MEGIFGFDGRRGALTTARPDARLHWDLVDVPDHVEVVLAPSREHLESGGSDARRLGPFSPSEASCVVTFPADWDVLYWRVESADDHGPTQRIERAPDVLGAWITHPDWIVSPRPTSSYWFEVDVEVPVDSRVALHVATAGVVAVFVNGLEAPTLLAPGIAEYRKETPATSLDLSALVVPGVNRLRIEIAAGPSWVEQLPTRYSKLALEAAPLQLSAMVAIDSPDGRTVIQSGDDWSCGRGGAIATHWYGGEDYVHPAEADAAEVLAVVVPPLPPLWWPEHPPIRVTETLPSALLPSTAPDIQLHDFGTNIAGRVRLRTGDLGGSFLLRPAELITDGRVSQWSTGSPIFHRVQASEAMEWTSRFSYQGFRYVEVEGEPSALEAMMLNAEVVHVTNAPVGSLSSRSDFVTRLHELVVRAVRGNMHSMFTDCPHREKLGWLEQLHLCFTALTRNFDVEAHLRDALHHMRVAQTTDGAIPNIAPEFADFSGHDYRGDPNAFREDPNWGRAIISTTWMHYRTYGDERVLHENAAAIREYVDYLQRREVGGLLDFGLGDWIALDPTGSREIAATHGYYCALRDAANVMSAIGKPAEARTYRAKADVVRSRVLAFSSELSPSSSQSDLALVLDLAEGDLADSLFTYLRGRIADEGSQIRVGEIALPALIRAFHTFDADEDLLALLSQPDVPGYGLQVASEATSLIETWTIGDGSEGEGSHNHFMLGMIEDWIHEVAVGLRQARGSVGWRKAEFLPFLSETIGRASASYRSPAGRYQVAWDAVSGRVDVFVPPGCELRVRVPDGWTTQPDHPQLGLVGPGSWSTVLVRA